MSHHILYKMLSLHRLKASLLQHKVYKGPMLWKNIDHSFCQTISHFFFLSHYWVKLAHSVNVLSCQTHSKWSQQKSLVQPLSFKDKSCIACTGLYRRCVTISLSVMRTDIETHLFGARLGPQHVFVSAPSQLLLLKPMWILDGIHPMLNGAMLQLCERACTYSCITSSKSSWQLTTGYTKWKLCCFHISF